MSVPPTDTTPGPQVLNAATVTVTARAGWCEEGQTPPGHVCADVPYPPGTVMQITLAPRPAPIGCPGGCTELDDGACSFCGLAAGTDEAGLALAHALPRPCPSGCGCVTADDPDRRECACDGPCCIGDGWPIPQGPAPARVGVGVVRHTYDDRPEGQECTCCPGAHVYARHIEGIEGAARCDWLYERFRDLPDGATVHLALWAVDPGTQLELRPTAIETAAGANQAEVARLQAIETAAHDWRDAQRALDEVLAGRPMDPAAYNAARPVRDAALLALNEALDTIQPPTSRKR